MKVPQAQLIDRVVKVPDLTHRQVPMSQGVWKDQAPGDEQISLEVYVYRMKAGQNVMWVQQEGYADHSSMIDVEMTFVPTCYHSSYQVSPIDREIGR